MIPAVYNIPNQYKGDTFDGLQFTLQLEDLTPISLVGASLKCQFRPTSKKHPVAKEITNVSGITVSNAALGIFSIDSFLVDLEVSIYYYDIQVTFSSGVVKTYIEGTISIIQDVTYG